MGKIPDKKFPVKIAGFPLPLYLGILALVIVCMYTGCLPGGIVGGMISSVFWARRLFRRPV